MPSFGTTKAASQPPILVKHKSLTCSRKSMRPVATQRNVAGDDSACGDVSHSDLFSMRSHNVLEHPVAVEEGVSEMVTNNDTIVANPHELGVAV